MKTLIAILSCILFVFQVMYAQIDTTNGIWKGDTVTFATGEVLAGLEEGVSQYEGYQIFSSMGLTVVEQFDVLDIALVKVPKGSSAISAATSLNSNKKFRYAEPNLLLHSFVNNPDDPYYIGGPGMYPHQWALKNTGQTPPSGTNDADIDAPEGWDYETGTSNIRVGILDSGIPMQDGELSHPDLDDYSRFIPGNNYVRWQFNPGYPQDDNGHGTHIAGIIGAETDNTEGIAGIDWNCELYVNKIFDSNGATFISVLRNAFEDAILEGSDIINFSGGGRFYSQTMEELVRYGHVEGSSRYMLQVIVEVPTV